MTPREPDDDSTTEWGPKPMGPVTSYEAQIQADPRLTWREDETPICPVEHCGRKCQANDGGYTPTCSKAHYYVWQHQLQLKQMGVHANAQPLPTNQTARQEVWLRQPQQDPKGTPSMKKLATSSKEAIEQWQLGLLAFDKRVTEHKAMYNPNYVVNLSKWVAPSAWISISRDLLKPPHKTDQGQPPCDEGVVMFLRQQGRYKPEHGHQVGKIRYASPLEQLLSVHWPGDKTTHLHAYEEFTLAWNKKLVTIRTVDVPPQRDQVCIIIKAIRPSIL